MRTLGLLGGMSWESTAIYYRLLNTGVRERMGGLHSAPLVLWSFDFAAMAASQADDDWAHLEHVTSEAARRLRQAGAEALLICTNTMHRLHAEIEAAAGIPVIHIADATGSALQRVTSRRPILLGTRFTMEGDFYRQRLRQRFGLKPLVPNARDREAVHRIIYSELCQGAILDSSRAALVQIIERLATGRADAVILGCTELTLLLGERDVPLPLVDTAAVHAQAGVDFMLGVPSSG